MVSAVDMGDYYRIPSDTRDLNYNKYFVEGEVITEAEDYNSHNTHRLEELELKEMLAHLREIQSELIGFGDPS
jgi:UDP-glucose 4-epimerase